MRQPLLQSLLAGLFLALCNAPAVGQGCIECGGEPDVVVVPDGQAAPSRNVHTGGHTAVFTVANLGSNLVVYLVSCAGSGTATCSGANPSSFYLASGDDRNVTATYSVGNPGSGTVTLTAIGGGATDQGSYTVTAVVPAGAPRLDVSPYNIAHQDFGRCASGCFAATHAQSTVPYISLDAPRSVALVYNGARVDPRAFVHVNVAPDTAYGSTPSEYRLRVKVNGAFVTFVNGDTALRYAYPGSAAHRLGGQFSIASYATGVYPLDIVVGAWYGSAWIENQWATKLVVVNETASPVARGWTIGGVQRLYSQGDGAALITA
ncbi:MAG: hypothetical protein ACREME_10475, partial [Gemmatimonadales bacterium]